MSLSVTNIIILYTLPVCVLSSSREIELLILYHANMIVAPILRSFDCVSVPFPLQNVFLFKEPEKKHRFQQFLSSILACRMILNLRAFDHGDLTEVSSSVRFATRQAHSETLMFRHDGDDAVD